MLLGLMTSLPKRGWYHHIIRLLHNRLSRIFRMSKQEIPGLLIQPGSSDRSCGAPRIFQGSTGTPACVRAARAANVSDSAFSLGNGNPWDQRFSSVFSGDYCCHVDCHHLENFRHLRHHVVILRQNYAALEHCGWGANTIAMARSTTGTAQKTAPNRSATTTGSSIEAQNNSGSVRTIATADRTTDCCWNRATCSHCSRYCRATTRSATRFRSLGNLPTTVDPSASYLRLDWNRLESPGWGSAPGLPRCQSLAASAHGRSNCPGLPRSGCYSHDLR